MALEMQSMLENTPVLLNYNNELSKDELDKIPPWCCKDSLPGQHHTMFQSGDRTAQVKEVTNIMFNLRTSSSQNTIHKVNICIQLFTTEIADHDCF